MKIIILIMALMGYTGSYAGNAKRDSLDTQITHLFYKNFPDAKSVTWDTQRDFVKVSFTQREQKLFAYYTTGGELMALSRMIQPNHLPILAQTNLNKMLPGKYLTDLFEVSSDGETLYYATIHDDNWNTILKSNSSGDWTTFKRSRVAGEIE